MGGFASLLISRMQTKNQKMKKRKRKEEKNQDWRRTERIKKQCKQNEEKI